MPVATLLCEGVRGSLDIRLLRLLVTGPTIEPDGSKWGMDHRIRARRKALGATSVFGLRDGDFTEAAPAQRPRFWEAQGALLGWQWARKEVENYLLDPAVVERVMALKPPKRYVFVPSHYRACLERARDVLAPYQAARIALSLSRPGPIRGLENTIEPTPRRTSDCRAGIRRRVSEHKAVSAAPAKAVLEHFETLRVECGPGGWRHADFLTCFAGKDLEAELGRIEPSFSGLCLQVLLRLEVLSDAGLVPNLPGWLPEWADLATAVANA